MRVFLLLVFAALLFAAGPAPAFGDDFDLIIQRQRDLLLAKPSAVPSATVEQWTRTLAANGAWPDINYQDQQNADWSPRYHLDRVTSMCKALLQPESPLRGNAALATAVNRALDYWIAVRPQCRNWWHNDIGTPGFMRDVIFLLGPQLQGARRTGAMDVLHQFKVKGEGANLVWTATLALSYGCLTKDEALVRQSAAQLADEIRVSKGEGIQPDWSFHQHGPRLQTFHYGDAYLHDLSRVAWMLAGTRYAVPPDKIQILVDHVLKGSQWMTRWNYTVPSTVDRAVSRPDVLGLADFDSNAELLAKLSPKDAPAMEQVRARIARRAPALEGFRAFPCSDFACYQRPDFSFFVKTISNRTQVTETTMNGENSKGALLNSGDTYLLREGGEYVNLAPVWDWTLLPGVTGVAGLTKVERQAFAGAVGDGESGCSAMDYGSTDPKGSGKMHAHKAYFCHGDAVVCLIGNLSAQADGRPARTALDQRLLRGPVVAGDAAGQTRGILQGETRLQAARWIYHDGLVYVPVEPTSLTVRAGPVAGSWRAINTSGSTNPVEKSVFLPFLTHGAGIENASAGYAILCCAQPAQAAAVAQAPGYRLLRNDANCQAIRWDDGTIMAVFYAPGELRDGTNLLMVTDQPCLVLSRVGRLFVSDPTQRGMQIHLAVSGGATVPITLPADGTTVEVHD